MPGISETAADEIGLKESLSCRLAAICSGCDRLHMNRAELESDRKHELKRLGLDTVPIDFKWIKSGGLRDRLEFSIAPSPFKNSFGLFNKDRTEIVDIKVCPQLSSALQNWLSDFRDDLPNVPARRSVRLRVSPTGLRGAWLDFANEDIRDLLDEEAWLQRQIDNGIVIEVGQKRKRVVKNSAGPRAHRLDDAMLEPWFETPVRGSATQLFGTVGTFTQPGFLAGKTLVETVLHYAGENQSRHIAEFGAGIGAFTLPLLATGAHVDVFESDRLALTALEKSLQSAKLNRTRLTIHAGDFILSNRNAEELKSGSEKFDLVIVDPPRPGLGKFIDAIASRAGQANWVYVSCYPESFAKDAQALQAKGLKLSRLTVVEQFPFTRHFEIVATFSRS